MTKYQIKEVKEKYNHAGSKAVDDVCNFASEEGYTPLYIRQRAEDTGFLRLVQNQLGFFCDWLNAFLRIKKNSYVMLQNPYKRKNLGRFFLLKMMKKVKKCKIISVIHDVEELREILFRGFSAEEFEFMKDNSDYFIVHNKAMEKHFLSRGFDKDKLVVLEIFDYIVKDFDSSKKERKADVAIAGNLGKEKSPYVYKLSSLENKISINLYGPYYEGKKESDLIEYHGSFPPDDVPSIIDGKFGLVWDGENIEGCSGGTGNYLRYNNPHKTSLYIVSHLPIVIWKEAAMARFVERENIGICVDSLEEIREKIDALTDEEYNEMLENTKNISDRLRNGYYLKKALSECEKRISKQ